MSEKAIELHNTEIQLGRQIWENKPLLRRIYRSFYDEISRYLQKSKKGKTVELGSGIGNLKSVLPDCIATDIFPNPWIDQVETAYSLSFGSSTLENVILFDVFHHLRYPGEALTELNRVLVPGGRLVIFEPRISLLGAIVYGLMHHEPVALYKDIHWTAPNGWTPAQDSYYAAQGNATRVFLSNRYQHHLSDWNILKVKSFSALSYVASGGFKGPQLYPDFLFPLMTKIDKICDFLPWIFSTRMLVVLEKKA
jgi:SAM-dependent methyltransferase